MPKPPQPRSGFWIVSTHVLTAGFAMPLLAGVATLVLAMLLELGFWSIVLLSLALQLLAYVGGTFYSISYLRRVALHPDPARLVRPSIITFVVLAVLGLAYHVYDAYFSPRPLPASVAPLVTGLHVLAYVSIIALFASITRRGLPTLGGAQQGFPVEPLAPASDQHAAPTGEAPTGSDARG